MLPKIASALARVLDPIKPIERPGGAPLTSKSPDSGGGGYGTPGHDSPDPKSEPKPSDVPNSRHSDLLPEDGVSPEHPEKRVSALPFQPGLTQVILDLHSQRPERSAGAAALTYETGAKDQKKNARLPKGSMLDKKVG